MTTDSHEEPQEQQPQEGAQEPETFDAEYVAKLRKEAAKYRTEAKANAEAVKRLSDIEEQSKTDAQRQSERLADLEKRYADAEVRALRANIASEHGINAEDRDLFLTGADEETLTAQAKRLADRESERKKRSNHVPNEGSNPQPQSDDRREFVRRLTGRD